MSLAMLLKIGGHDTHVAHDGVDCARSRPPEHLRLEFLR